MGIKICLDAGHYGKYNISPVNKNYIESDMAWKLHLLLKKYLEQYGIEVITTRADKNTDLGLVDRGKKSKGCDLFISLHSNACDTESVDYPVIIVPISGKGDEIGNKLADCVTAAMGTKQKGKIYKRKGGGDWDYYSVIYGAVQVGVVGIIIEHSFHTNLAATNWLLNDSNLEKLAKAEADVLAEHYGLKKITTTESKAIEAGDIVSVSSDAVYYNGVDVPDFVVAKKWIVKSVSGDRAVIDKSTDGKFSINSPINVKYLTADKKKFEPYTVKLVTPIHKSASADSPVVGTIDNGGVYTIVEENGKWGKLKSGAGWINLDNVKKA